MNNEELRELEALRQGYSFRMSLHLRIQHLVFALCVIVLAFTGLALYLGDTEFGRWAIALQGGFENRGLLHRVAAVGLICCTVYHIVFSLFSAAGSREFRRRMFRQGDLRQGPPLSEVPPAPWPSVPWSR